MVNNIGFTFSTKTLSRNVMRPQKILIPSKFPHIILAHTNRDLGSFQSRAPCQDGWHIKI